MNNYVDLHKTLSNLYECENIHLKNIIEILLTGTWRAKENKQLVNQLFSKYSAEDLAAIFFEKCVWKKTKAENVLKQLVKEGKLKA